MTIIGDASKARLIAVFIDHFIAFALMMLAVAFVPESLPVVKAVFFFVIYLAYFVVLEALWSRTLGKFSRVWSFASSMVARVIGPRR
jgi:hypothetical protein